MALFDDTFDEIRSVARNEMEEAEYVAYLEEQRYSNDPDSIRIQTLWETLDDPDVRIEGINLIIEQMFNWNVNYDGTPTPRYSKHTIKKKARIPGYPPEALVRYTNRWTGLFYQAGIIVQINENTLEYDFYPANTIDRIREAMRGTPFSFREMAHFQYIPNERVGLTPDNQRYFMDFVGQILDRKLDKWMYEKLTEAGINPLKYGYYGF